MKEKKCPCEKEKCCPECTCEQCEPIDEQQLFDEYPILKRVLEMYEKDN